MVRLDGDNNDNILDASIYGLSNDLLFGYGGKDTLYGGEGADTLDGDEGDDKLYGQAGEDQLFGDEGNDYLSGGADKDILHGGIGDDTLEGDEGNDVLYGDQGNDTLRGGEGHDELVGRDGNDILHGDGGNDNLNGDEGMDQLYGGSGDDYLYGGDFPGSASVDYLYGGSGNDTYGGDSLDLFFEYAGEGIDTVYAASNYTLKANFENLILAVASVGTGNDLDNMIRGDYDSVVNHTLSGLLGNDTLYGYKGNDTLDGGAGNDILNGYDGDDYLNGRSGTDTMTGGRGNDRYVVDSVFDVVVEKIAEGVDTVISSINYTLGVNVENLTLTESAINGTGNDLDNYILGTAGNNVISAKGGNDTVNGRGGNDIIVGGAGNDTLVGDVGADKFRYEFQTEGLDVIRDFNRTEGDKIEIIKSSFGATSLSQFSYNSTTGALFFNASSTSTPIQLATIANKPAGFSVQLDVVLV
jgi:Ca2+-binding RTX toxin-like protein